MQGLPEIGDVLDGTYEIEALLGQGGFGAVYLARQMSMDRQVAIKVLVAHAMRVEEMIERFRREVLAVRDLSHPNTIRIYDFRDREDGLLYYVMEYIKGPTLKDVIKEGPMPAERVIRIMKQILKSLSEAHSQNIVHRDLKPANIMLADLHGETDYVKVVDFGIAKIVNESEAGEDEADPLTSAGVLVGTLRYMAPEQITGQGIGPQSDLYAAALMGVEMLTGESVFAGTGRWEVLHKQISDEPVELTDEVINSELGPIFQKALEKQIDDRYKSSEEMLEALSEIDGAPSTMSGIIVKPEDLKKPEPVASPASQDSGQLEVGGNVDDDEQTMMAPLPELDQRKDEVDDGEDEPAEAPAEKASNPVPNVGSFSPSAYSTSDNDDVTGATAFPKKRSKLPLVMVAVAATLLIVFVAVYMTRQTGDEPASEAVAATEPAEKDEIDPSDSLEAPADEAKGDAPEAESRFVRIETPGTEAQVFEGSTLIGKTPIKFMVAGTKSYRLVAEGHDERTVEFKPDGPTEMKVEFKEEATARLDKEDEKSAPGSMDKPDEKVEKKPTAEKPRAEKKPTTEKKPADPGWVDIKPDKKPEKKKPAVPLF